MIRMTQVKIPASVVYSEASVEDIKRGIVSKQEESVIRVEVAKMLKLPDDELHELVIEKKSIDARKKDEIYFVYNLTFHTIRENKVVHQYGKNNAFVIPDRLNKEENSIMKDVALQIALGRKPKFRPIVVGMGPAGLFAALGIAEAGLCPIVLERGADVTTRDSVVNNFWNGGELNTETNVQFGEGGAGTFSDGKLYTGVKDKSGKIKSILETFANYGAPSQIVYDAKPHVGTDRLKDVVVALRERIMALGGEVFFNTRFERPILNSKNELEKVVVSQEGKQFTIDCESLVLATGHSSRDTFKNLLKSGIVMQPKSFAVGVRVEHSQSMISRNQYGSEFRNLPPADYKLTHTTKEGRGVYTFCMCPGGYVVNSSSSKGMLCVNGMSYYDRNSANANSAVVVSVNPSDFATDDVLAGVKFQKSIEKFAYESAGGKIPLQLYGDFVQNELSTGFGLLRPLTKGDYDFANLRKVLPDFVCESIIEGMTNFDNKIKGFADDEIILLGVETRTSSPVRIVRNETLQSNIKGIYPCGEGAGYAGGIISAALDGMRVAEKIVATTELS